MPLTGKPSHDIPVELRAGKPQKQAVAIALNKERSMKGKDTVQPVPVNTKYAPAPKKPSWNGNSVVMTASEAATAYKPPPPHPTGARMHDDHEEEGFETPYGTPRGPRDHEDVRDVKPVRVNPAPMVKTVPVSKAKHVKDAVGGSDLRRAEVFKRDAAIHLNNCRAAIDKYTRDLYYAKRQAEPDPDELNRMQSLLTSGQARLKKAQATYDQAKKEYDKALAESQREDDDVRPV